jgi:DNA-binding MarR family transcriptional regulator/N-acetylglutamate synthase-like GNAT family acetyltransferase
MNPEAQPATMSTMTAPVADTEVAAVRHFNRLYTRVIGVLDQHLLRSPFSLTEARVLFEIAQRDDPTATAIGASLGLDAGYLSRIVQNFSEQGLVVRKPLPSDGRQHGLRLTAKGRAAFKTLDDRSRDDVAGMLMPLASGSRLRLIEAMKTIEWVLAPATAGNGAIALRAHQPGDLGWVVQQNGALYAAEYGWDISYEALVAEIVAQFVRQFDAQREACWIAERDGIRIGAVFVVKQSDEVAKLRLLLVDPAARGLGVGKRLVDQCIAFARARGYRKLTLWTQDILLKARRIYSQAGFVRVAVEPHRSFGHDLVGETWELVL